MSDTHLSENEINSLKMAFQKFALQVREQKSNIIADSSSDRWVTAQIYPEKFDGGSLTISTKDFEKVLENFQQTNPQGSSIPDIELNSILKDIDLNQSGAIDESEFVAIMSKLLYPNTFTYVQKEIRIRISIKRIIDINIVDQQFTAEFFVEASWVDTSPELREKDNVPLVFTFDRKFLCIPEDLESKDSSGLPKSNTKEEKKFFHPMLSFQNAVDMMEKEEWFKVFRTPEEAIICHRISGKGTFKKTMDLHMFPMDIQELTMILASGIEHPNSHSTEDSGVQSADDQLFGNYRVKLIQNLSNKYRSLVGLNEFYLSNVYELYPGVRFQELISDPMDSASGRTYSKLQMAAIVRRKTGYWALNILLPMFFITSIAFAFLSIPASDISSRSSITLTTLLTTVAFKFIIADKLPNISYLSIIDYYVLFCIFLQSVMVLVIVVNGVLMRDSTDYDFGNHPGLTCAVGFLSWVALHIIGYLIVFAASIRYGESFKSPNRHVYVKNLRAGTTSADILKDFNIIQSMKTVEYKRSGILMKQVKLGRNISLKHWNYDNAIISCQNAGTNFESRTKDSFDIITFECEDDAHKWEVTMNTYLGKVYKQHSSEQHKNHKSSNDVLRAFMMQSMGASFLGKKEENVWRLHCFESPFNHDGGQKADYRYPVIEPLKPEWACLSMEPTKSRLLM